MSTMVDAIYEDGVFKPEGPVDLYRERMARIHRATFEEQGAAFDYF